MIEFKIKTNKKKKQLVKCPDNIHEVDFATWIEIERSKRDGAFNEIKLFSILTGINYDFIHDSSSDRVRNLVLQSIAFYSDFQSSFSSGVVGSHVVLGDTALKIPVNVDGFSIGQHLYFSRIAEEVREGKRDDFDFMTAVVSVFIEPMYRERQLEKKNDKLAEDFTDHEKALCSFSPDRAKAFEETILKCKALDIYPLYAFFLTKKIRSTETGQKQTKKTRRTIIQRLTRRRTILD
jgi:hypothetical protein